MMQVRQRNDGLRKLCECPRRTWAKCAHPWHFSFKWNEEHYRFSLERIVTKVVKDATGKWKRDRATLGDEITDKTRAEQERDRLRTAIREGTLQQAAERPQRETLTLTQLMAAYRKQYLSVHRAGTLKNADYVMKAILRTEIERPDGGRRAFGEWLVTDITTAVIEQYQQARVPTGSTGTNRHLEVLRSLFYWATASSRKLATDNPFLDAGSRKPAIKMLPERSRRRRLQAGEAARILKACGAHLYAVVNAAIETGMRRGEILSLQWSQVRLDRGEIFLPAEKTKTKTDRTIPISSTLRAILEMRRNGPDDKEHPAEAYVFGNEAGERVQNVKRAWERTVLAAHGHKPSYIVKHVGEGGHGAEGVYGCADGREPGAAPGD